MFVIVWPGWPGLHRRHDHVPRRGAHQVSAHKPCEQLTNPGMYKSLPKVHRTFQNKVVLYERYVLIISRLYIFLPAASEIAAVRTAGDALYVVTSPQY